MAENRCPGLLFVVSAPSGVGKTTLIQAVRQNWKALRFSVSCTTRKARPDEVSGRDYHFLSVQEFECGIQSGRFLEWAKVHGQYYGTDGEQVANWLSHGDDVLLDIDVQGTKQVLSVYPLANTIFILPPSLETLKERLQKRATESKEQIAIRLSAAATEIREAPCFDYIIENDLLDEAIADLDSILRACHCTQLHKARRLRPFLLSANNPFQI